jgi:hypothetical protein
MEERSFWLSPTPIPITLSIEDSLDGAHNTRREAHGRLDPLPHRAGAMHYSLECVEWGFSEVGLPLYGVLGSSPPGITHLAYKLAI